MHTTARRSSDTAAVISQDTGGPGRRIYLRLARSAGLADRDGVLTALRALDGPAWETSAALLKRHQIGRLALSTVSPADLHAALSPAFAAALVAWPVPQRYSAAACLEEFTSIQDALDADGIPVLVLKGFSLAERLYGSLDRRPQSDIDLLVRARDAAWVKRSLPRAGFVRTGYDLHAQSFSRNGLTIDVHRDLRRTPAFRFDRDEPWASAVDMAINGVRFRTLSDEWTLVLLVLGLFEDLGQGMVKIKQLLDLNLFLRAVDPAFEWDAFFERRRADNTSGVCLNVLGLVLALFDAHHEAPRLTAALSLGGAPVPLTPDEQLTLVFAPRKDAGNLRWFRSVYPGNFEHYLAWFWYGGFPANLREFRLGRLWSTLRLAAARTS